MKALHSNGQKHTLHNQTSSWINIMDSQAHHIHKQGLEVPVQIVFILEMFWAYAGWYPGIMSVDGLGYNVSNIETGEYMWPIFQSI